MSTALVSTAEKFTAAMAEIENAAKLVTVAEMAALEKQADAAGHSYAAMMEIAGRGVAQRILARYPARGMVLVLAGPGNNGGDGLVCARYLQQAGVRVCLYLWKRRTDPAHDYQQHYAQAVALGIPTAHTDTDGDLTTLRTWLAATDLVVDALLGTGANRPIEGQLAVLLTLVREQQCTRAYPVVAVDCVSGLNCDTGSVDPHAVAADLTLTFAYAKHGHYQFPGVDVTGRLQVLEIGIDPHFADAIQTFVLTEAQIRRWLPTRPNNSHKGTYGKLMAAVGSMNYPGAAYLSCAAAGRVGAGLLTGAVAQPIWAVVAAKLVEATWLPLPTGTDDAYGVIDETATPRLTAALDSYDALLLGCGLGQHPTTQRFVRQLLRELPPLAGVLIDADGLNCLAKTEQWPALLPENVVLTPHAAELGRLAQMPVAAVVAQRWTLAREKAREWQAVLLAKGPYTVIAHPDGWMAVLPIATAALATAGTGDVLSGTVAGLLTQALDPFRAACVGAWLHGAAGLRCAAEMGTTGVLASDLLNHLPHMIQHMRASQ